MEENINKERAGYFAIIFSFLFPVIGVIIYFVNRKNVENANAYLYAAGVSFLIWYVFQVIAAATIS